MQNFEIKSDAKGIRDDLYSLKDNVTELAKHLKEEGSEKSHQMAEVLLARLKELQGSGRDHLHTLEGQVREKPLQSVAVAFVAGAIVSMLLGRR
ncbi:MAG: hypothetical protein JNK24_06455 [Alphaproteobacteria bacterium]|nr:hypothetical protein [Alphaproteobacteria bacterium]